MAGSSAFLNGLGVFLPNRPIDNEHVEDVLGHVSRASTAVKRRVLLNNGIQWRYYAIDPQTGRQTHTNARMTSQAIRALCERTDFDLAGLDCLACGTSSADQLIPSHASMVHAELGCGPCDVAATTGVCCSGMTAFKYGYTHVMSGIGPNAIVTGSELASVSLRASHFQQELALKQSDRAAGQVDGQPLIRFENEFLRWMLSDGAGSALIEASPGRRGQPLRIDWIDVLSYASQSEPCMYGGMKKLPDGSSVGYRSVDDPVEFYRSGMLNLAQDVDILRERLPVLMKEFLRTVRDKRGLVPERIDWLAPHYSSEWFRQPLYDGLAELNLEIPFEKWFTNLATKGNTGAASIYIILEELIGSERVKRGDRILCLVPESARMTFCLFHLTAV
jgi:3-oxoacyl-[acyl-carrier-protein] synthase-3